MAESNSLALATELRDACTGHPVASIRWPHRLLHRAADEIERLQALENSKAGLADAHSKSPAPSSLSERIAVLEAERDAAWERGMRDAAHIAERRFEDDPGYCVYADGSEIASEIREAVRARSALAPLGEE